MERQTDTQVDTQIDKQTEEQTNKQKKGVLGLLHAVPSACPKMGNMTNLAQPEESFGNFLLF